MKTRTLFLVSAILVGIARLHADAMPLGKPSIQQEPGKPRVATFEMVWKEVEPGTGGGYRWTIEGTDHGWVKLHPETAFKEENWDKKKRYQVTGAILEADYGTYHVWVYEFSEAKDDQPSAGPVFAVGGTDEALIPAPLNGLLPRIRPGMSVKDVEAVLSPAYPKVKSQMSVWSGQTGYYDYKLDDRFTLSVASITRDGKEVVHDDLTFYVYDGPARRRIDLKIYDWAAQSQKK